MALSRLPTRQCANGRLAAARRLGHHGAVSTSFDRDAAAEAVRLFLKALGKKAEGPLAQTPELVAEAWCHELLEGEGADAAAALGAEAIEAPAGSGTVALTGLSVTCVCPHHLLPSQGTADVVYLPGERVAGFGAISRALRALTRRLTLQEEASQAMADVLVEALGARGALCRMRLVHSCLVARGAREVGAAVETLSLSGSFVQAGPDRDLALASLGSFGPVSRSAAASCSRSEP